MSANPSNPKKLSPANKKPFKVKKPNKRRMSRIFAMQALYQWGFTTQDSETLVEDFLFEQNMQSDAVDLDYFQVLLSGTLDHIKSIDTLLTPHLDRQLTQLNPVELAVLRLGAFELAYRKEVPYAVAINEAIELTKMYGSADGHKFVNGVLNSLSSSLQKSSKT